MCVQIWCVCAACARLATLRGVRRIHGDGLWHHDPVAQLLECLNAQELRVQVGEVVGSRHPLECHEGVVMHGLDPCLVGINVAQLRAVGRSLAEGHGCGVVDLKLDRLREGGRPISSVT